MLTNPFIEITDTTILTNDKATQFILGIYNLNRLEEQMFNLQSEADNFTSLSIAYEDADEGLSDDYYSQACSIENQRIPKLYTQQLEIYNNIIKLIPFFDLFKFDKLGKDDINELIRDNSKINKVLNSLTKKTGPKLYIFSEITMSNQDNYNIGFYTFDRTYISSIDISNEIYLLSKSDINNDKIEFNNHIYGKLTKYLNEQYSHKYTLDEINNFIIFVYIIKRTKKRDYVK